MRGGNSNLALPRFQVRDGPLLVRLEHAHAWNHRNESANGYASIGESGFWNARGMTHACVSGYGCGNHPMSVPGDARKT